MQRKAGIIIGYLTFGIKMAIQILFVPIMLRLLGQNEYGLYQMVASIIAYLSLLDCGFGTSYLKFYSETIDDREKEKRLNSTYLSLFMGIAGIVVLCTLLMAHESSFLLGNKITANDVQTAKILFLIIGCNMALGFINSIFNAIITSRECFIFQKIINLLATLLNPFLSVLLLMLGYGSIGLVIASIMITAATLLVNVYYVIVKIKAPIALGICDFPIVKRISGFSVFLLINMIIDQINWNMDKFLLGRIIGTSAVTFYSIGAQINNIYIQMPDMIASVFAPKANKIVATNQNPLPEINDLFVKVGRMQSIVASCILLAFIMLGKEFIFLWVGSEFNSAYYVSLLLIAPAYIPICQSLGVDIQRAMNKHQFRSIVYLIISIINAALSVLLIYNMAEIGAALGTTIAMIVGNGIIMNWYYSKKMKLDIRSFWKSIVSLYIYYVPAIIITLIAKRFLNAYTWSGFIICCLIYIVVFGIFVYKFGLNNYEKNMIFRKK